MVTNPLIAKRSTEAKSLLRELYRHASCFFDDHSREFLKTRIRDRFREYRVVDTPHRQSKLLHNGRKIASTLQRANAGDPGRIMTVMRHSYGRVGKRWHELMKPYLSGMGRTEELIPGDPRTTMPKLNPQLTMLLVQHMSRKKLEPDIPEKNKWLKPFPPRNKANLAWRHFSSIIKKVTPPLTEDETLRLERLATGEEEPVPPRRRKVVQCRDNLDTNNNHDITKRFKRRIYMNLLKDCPRLVWNDKNRKWAIRLSQVGKSVSPIGDDPDDFAGVKSNGNRFSSIRGKSASDSKKSGDRLREEAKDDGVIWEGFSEKAAPENASEEDKWHNENDAKRRDRYGYRC